MIAIPVWREGESQAKTLTKGQYVLTFKSRLPIADIFYLRLNLPAWLPIVKRVRLDKLEILGEADTVKLWIEVEENPIPIAVIVAGIIAFISVMGFFSLSKIDKIISKPQGAVFLIAVAVIGFLIVLKIVR